MPLNNDGAEVLLSQREAEGHREKQSTIYSERTSMWVDSLSFRRALKPFQKLWDGGGAFFKRRVERIYAFPSAEIHLEVN